MFGLAAVIASADGLTGKPNPCGRVLPNVNYGDASMKKSSALIAALSVFTLASPAFAAGGDSGGGNGGATPPDAVHLGCGRQSERHSAQLRRIADNAHWLCKQQQPLGRPGAADEDHERSNRNGFSTDRERSADQRSITAKLIRQSA